jgi:hypothetical protein
MLFMVGLDLNSGRISNMSFRRFRTLRAVMLATLALGAGQSFLACSADDQEGSGSTVLPSGTNGSGSQGASGGQNGTTGTSGTSGTSGINGSSGNTGTSGSATGMSGTGGTSSSNGTSGAGGSSGTQGQGGQSGSAGTGGSGGTSGQGGQGGSTMGTGGTGTSGTGGSGTNGSGTGNEIWNKASLTEFESYPDPGSEECIKYNGCEWAGQFAALDGVQPESWVQAHNIAAVHSKDFAKYKLKTLRLRKNGKEIDVTVYDMCADSDCSGCCTENAQPYGFLIDVEKYTAQRFGVSTDGMVEWRCLDCN